ncbi:glycoside hydrolase family 3 C-terminal domain-containing protein [Georgenia faecalis]|uniref:glycoside hydrolase family 3 C-terminal domain-containing protein n=1 Tax=Georgenia faecalis TaxID=2483799 RepID=UPI000FD9D8F9|nr:glycoside hydrolase family 3 C-terminal domain-containing protein [Georgenia faecalis]
MTDRLLPDPTDAVHQDRARRLCAELTLEEKLSLLHQFSPAVDRVGLAPFRTGTEAAHGVAWEGEGTVFPQPVGLAATWDTDLLERIGEAVGNEVRDKHDADPWVSLNVWAPVVNPLRHPLWGRNEEGFSEDPVLTGELATAYARGLRGRDATFWRTVPTLKHYLAYNMETDRSSYSASVPPRTLHDYELRAYRGPIEAGVIGGIMPSYNLINGRPTHLDTDLLDLARSWSPWPLCFFSDAFAPANVFGNQAFYPDPATAYAAMLEAGIDSFTDQDRDSATVVGWLRDAVTSGLVSEDLVDRAVERVLTVRARTGELDATADPFGPGRRTPADLVAHGRLARLAVARGVVVLGNDGILPLQAPARVAVVGPLAEEAFLDWYSGEARETVSLGDAVRERYGAEAVTVTDGADHVVLRAVDAAHHVRPVGNRMVEGPGPFEECAIAVQDWGQGIVTLRNAGSREVWTCPEDRIVRTDAPRVSNYWDQSFLLHRHPDGTWSIFSRGRKMWLRRRGTSGTLAAAGETLDDADRFVMTTVRSGAEQVRAAAAGADVVVVALGNQPLTGAHETADRTTLALPPAMGELARVARAANPRCVLTLVSSFPYALGDLADLPAVVWSSHGGQELGHGLLDVLAGDEEPYGHLTQTWYAGDADLPPLDVADVEAVGATYWYGDAVPQYPFGHGLSYTTVAYHRLEVGAWPGTTGALPVRVELENTGERPVDELVQLYVQAPADKGYGPRLRLHAHTRVALAPGQRGHADLVLDVAELASWHAGAGAPVTHPGTYVLGVGPSSGDLRLREPLVVAGDGLTGRPSGAPVDATTFDGARGVRIVERTRTAGQAVTPERTTAHLTYDGVELTGAGALTALVSSPGAAGRLTLALRQGDRRWTLGSRAVAATGAYAWAEVAWPVPGDVSGACAVEVTLTAPTQLAELRTATPPTEHDATTRSDAR